MFLLIFMGRKFKYFVMSEKLKIGVFGAYRGQAMIDVLLNHPKADLVAVCDKYRSALYKVEAKAK